MPKDGLTLNQETHTATFTSGAKKSTIHVVAIQIIHSLVSSLWGHGNEGV